LLATTYGVDAALVTTSGYLTNAALIAHLLGPEDIAVCDSYIHNSIVGGTQWAGCRRINFKHNDPVSLESTLRMSRRSATRAMVIIEGHYSMDGDTPRLAEIVSIARRYDCSIMIDEAHSFGVLGATGRGAREMFGLEPEDIDIWMGTLSKALGSAGGFVAGNQSLIDGLRFAAPGLSTYTTGPAPSVAGAALAALKIMLAEPDRVACLHANARYFHDEARLRGLDLGSSEGTPIVPVIIGDDIRAMSMSVALLYAGVNAHALVHPVVPIGAARIRFFVTAEHTREQIETTVSALANVAAIHDMEP